MRPPPGSIWYTLETHQAFDQMEDGNEQAMKDFLKQQKVGPAKKSSQSWSYLMHDMGISANLFFSGPFSLSTATIHPPAFMDNFIP